ncbi:MAG: gluconate 2-dehydrogenase subunit 3 family protein [Candidatus Eremiobacteraeota bacterium]|nr:gluconate 2-dehydrogenase subunit 3 family protein [Candidatus Eremiobacteraeota bacterium]
MNPRSRDGDLRPSDPATGEPIGPLPQPGYYPQFSTMSQEKFWDAATRSVVRERLDSVPPIRYFSAEQTRFWKAVCERMLPQDDRDEAHKIPIVPHIDKRLYEDAQKGYRYEEMPPSREAFALGMQGIEEIAQRRFERSFVELGPWEQEDILRMLHDGKPPAGMAVWEKMPAHRFFLMLMHDCAEAYYSHPWAWDEIGFGGPAYPRAYMRLEDGQPEPWETDEKRYAWDPPATSVSGRFELVAGQVEHYGSDAQ